MHLLSMPVSEATNKRTLKLSYSIKLNGASFHLEQWVKMVWKEEQKQEYLFT